VRDEHAAEFAPQAHADPSTGGNPRPLTIEDFEQLYLRCIRGELEA
jgi:alcohol dehydrogenase class IV